MDEVTMTPLLTVKYPSIFFNAALNISDFGGIDLF